MWQFPQESTPCFYILCRDLTLGDGEKRIFEAFPNPSPNHFPNETEELDASHSAPQILFRPLTHFLNV